MLLPATRAGAQEIEPYEFVVLPAGTNLAIGYYVYGHDTDFNIAGGPTIKDSGVEVNLFVARYVHYTSVLGYPAGFQIYQAFGRCRGPTLIARGSEALSERRTRFYLHSFGRTPTRTPRPTSSSWAFTTPLVAPTTRIPRSMSATT